MTSLVNHDREFHLEKAPIVEAVISIKMSEQLPQSALPDLAECGAALQDRYPIREPILAQQFQINVGNPSGSSIGTPAQIGLFCKEVNSHRVVHLKLDGFGFSELAPYSSWGAFFPAAKDAWRNFRAAVGSGTMESWSIRYINRISWPEDDQMEDYLRVHPNVPDRQTQDLLGCFIRLQLSIKDPSKGVFVQQLFRVPSLEQGKVSYVLDHEFSFSALGLTEAELWSQIDCSREIKNHFFRLSLTEKALEMYR
jgi:uncharacterized protein (TIGR04255 family)